MVVQQILLFTRGVFRDECGNFYPCYEQLEPLVPFWLYCIFTPLLLSNAACIVSYVLLKFLNALSVWFSKTVSPFAQWNSYCWKKCDFSWLNTWSLLERYYNSVFVDVWTSNFDYSKGVRPQYEGTFINILCPLLFSGYTLLTGWFCGCFLTREFWVPAGGGLVDVKQ